MTEIRAISNPQERAELCDRILRALPDWFGIERYIAEYVQNAREQPLFAAFYNHQAVGFVSLKLHNQYTAEILSMGVLREYHRHGLGKQLIFACEQYGREQGLRFLTVKTLDETAKVACYDITRQFYLSTGFLPLEVLQDVWNEGDPCLLLIKCIDG